MVHFNEANTSDTRCRSIRPHSAGDVHPLIQRVAIGEVDKVEKGVHVVGRPDHLILAVSSRSAHRKSDLGAIVREREPNRFGGRNDAEGHRVIGDLDPEQLTRANIVGLGQELRRIDLCKKSSIYAPRNVIKRENQHTFSSIIPGLEPIEGADRDRGKVGKEHRATNEGGDGIGHDFIAPCMLQSADTLNVIREAPGESHGSFGMAARRIDSAEEALGDLALFRLVVWSERNARFDATSDIAG